jgi:UDP-N-acetylmuramate dehydrogenase
MEKPPFEFYQENYPLAPHAYYRVGGPARLALTPRNREEAEAAWKWMRLRPERWLILGNGSNVLFADAGFDGIVLFTGGVGEIESLGGDRYAVDAGYPLETLVRNVIVLNNYAGTGSLTGIPGSVGGALFMNAGTVNGCAGELTESVEVATSGGVETRLVSEYSHGYRSQTFCNSDEMILRVIFQFKKAAEDQRAIYEHYLKRRREKQPQGYCCGSVFKNPQNDHAGRLIEACGMKGARKGGAVVSPMHANFIMNENNATCADILWLIGECKRRVYDKFGIELREEVRIIG